MFVDLKNNRYSTKEEQASRGRSLVDQLLSMAMILYFVHYKRVKEHSTQTQCAVTSTQSTQSFVF